MLMIQFSLLSKKQLYPTPLITILPNFHSAHFYKINHFKLDLHTCTIIKSHSLCTPGHKNLQPVLQ